MAERTGKVYLVGAGPGAADLVTLRAAELVGAAAVVLYDVLANENLLSLASSEAELICADTSGRASTTVKREELMRALIERARAGKSVVRLCDGDPCFSVAAAREAEELAAAGIEFEIVPGVNLATAAPAFAGVPLTDESSVTFVNLERDIPALSWAELAGAARNHGTIVLSARSESIRESLARLIAEGAPADTPAAAIFDGTTAAQTLVAATLATLAAEIERIKLTGLAIIVVGERAGVRQQLRWFEQRALFGRRIVVTRGSSNAAALTRPLRALGAEVIEFPTIDTIQPDSYAALDAAIANLASFDWVIFTSATGVDSFIARLAALGRDIREFGKAQIAAIGPATASRLKRYALKIAVQPSEYRAEAIAQALGEERIRGARFLIPRAQVAREALPGILAVQGASAVEVVPCYKTVMPKGARVERMRRLVDAGAIDLVALTSSSTATNFSAIAGAIPHGLKAAAIGPITAETARALGFDVVVSPSEYTIDALVAAIAAYFAKHAK